MALTNEVKVEIGRILESDEGVNVRIHKLFKLFLDNALARHETVPPSLVLCHPSNRGGGDFKRTRRARKGGTAEQAGCSLGPLGSQLLYVEAPRQEKVSGGCEQDLGEPPPGPTCTPKRCRKILVGRLQSLHSLHESITLRHYRRKRSHQARRSCKDLPPHRVAMADLGGYPRRRVSFLANGPSFRVELLEPGACQSKQVEVLLTIGRYVSLHGMTVQQAKQRCLEAEPACRDYIDVLAHFVARYGGGIGFPLVEFLGRFLKGLWCQPGAGVRVYASRRLLRLQNWKKTKKIQPTVLDAEIAKQYFVSASSSQAEAFELGKAQLELYRELIANRDGKVGSASVTPLRAWW